MEAHKLDVIFNGVFGSNLYGLATPTSDKDFKGVYLPTKEQVIFNNFKDSIDEQTTEVDTTFYSLSKFLKILEKCDTVSLDMLHTPKEYTIKSSSLWEELRGHRSDLYCKSMRGVLSYAKTQSSKYGHKVERFEELTELSGLLSCLEDDVKVEDTTLIEIINRSNFKYISYAEKKGDVEANIDVCGSRYQTKAQVYYLRQGITAKLKRYGNRTKQGSLLKGDWKSLSHSVRVLYQLDELITSRDLVFPLIKKDIILSIKLGEESQEYVMDLIDTLYDQVISKLSKSDLPDHPDMTNLKSTVMAFVDL